MRGEFHLIPPEDGFRDSVLRFLVHGLLAAITLACVAWGASVVANSFVWQAPDAGFLRQLHALERNMLEAEILARGFVVTGAARQGDATLAAIAEAGPRLRALEDSVAGQPTEATARALLVTLRERLGALRQGMALRASDDLSGTTAWLGMLDAQAAGPRGPLAAFAALREAEEARLAAEAARAHAQAAVAVGAVLAGFALVLAMMLIASGSEVVLAWRRLRRIGLDPRSAFARLD